MFTVYREIFTENGIERYYFGNYSNRNRANEVALEEGCCVCEAERAEEFGIRNLP